MEIISLVLVVNLTKTLFGLTTQRHGTVFDKVIVILFATLAPTISTT